MCPLHQENGQADFANYDLFKGLDLEEADSTACDGEGLERRVPTLKRGSVVLPWVTLDPLPNLGKQPQPS